MPAGRCRCSPHRRAFFIPYPRRHDRFGAGGGEFGTVCPPAAAVARPHRRAFFIQYPRRHDRFGAAGGNLAPCARRPLSLFAMPACIFRFVSPPVWSSRRRQRGIYHRVPAGRCRCSPCRRAFFIQYPRRHDRFGAAGGNLAPCARRPLSLFAMPACIFRFVSPPVSVVSPPAARNSPPCARRPLPLFAMPACIFYPVSPPAWSSSRWRRRIWHRVPAGRCRCSPCRRAFFVLYPRRSLSLLASPACIFHPISPPACLSRRCQR